MPQINAVKTIAELYKEIIRLERINAKLSAELALNIAESAIKDTIIIDLIRSKKNDTDNRELHIHRRTTEKDNAKGVSGSAPKNIPQNNSERRVVQIRRDGSGERNPKPQEEWLKDIYEF